MYQIKISNIVPTDLHFLKKLSICSDVQQGLGTTGIQDHYNTNPVLKKKIPQSINWHYSQFLCFVYFMAIVF